VVLALFGVFALFGSLFLWGAGFVLTAPPGVDIAFPVTDTLINAPASIITALGLWRLRKYGYLGSYFVSGFYIYASAYIFVEVIQGGSPYPFEIVLPQALALATAVALLIFPNRYRDRFS
jgi:hypothetical protein